MGHAVDDEAGGGGGKIAKKFGDGGVDGLAVGAVGDVDDEMVSRVLQAANTTREEAEEIYKLTALCGAADRFVIPPAHREEAIEMMKDTLEHKQEVGFGFLSGPKRGA